MLELENDYPKGIEKEQTAEIGSVSLSRPRGRFSRRGYSLGRHTFPFSRRSSRRGGLGITLSHLLGD